MTQQQEQGLTYWSSVIGLSALHAYITITELDSSRGKMGKTDTFKNYTGMLTV